MVGKLCKYLFDPKYRFIVNQGRGWTNNMPDKRYVEKQFEIRTGEPLDLNNPRKFNEKIQWLKLYDHRSIYTEMADKLKAKEHVGRLIGKDHIVSVIDVWERAEDINFAKMPEKFVIKCNHNSGLGMCVCQNKKELNYQDVVESASKGMQQDYYLPSREWAYKNIKRRIFAEEYVETVSGVLTDMKFYCFNGEPKFYYLGQCVISDGPKRDLITYYDMEGNKTPFQRLDHKPFPYAFERPVFFREMQESARKIAKEFPFVRVDFFITQDNFYFAECTFYPGEGYSFFSPIEWEEKIGDMLILPNVPSREK